MFAEHLCYFSSDSHRWDDFGTSSCAMQRVTALPDAATYRTAVDAMVAAGKYAAAAALCGDAHDTATFCHYTLPLPPGAPGAHDNCIDVYVMFQSRQCGVRRLHCSC